jgi:TonB family protein
MTGQVMLYAVVVGLLIVPAAWLADRAASLRRVPRRWGWVVALGIALALPMAAPLRDAARPDDVVTGIGGAMSDQSGGTASWTVVVVGVRDGLAGFGSVLASWDAWAATVWGASSAVVMIALVAGTATLRWRRRDWRPATASNTVVLVAQRTGPAVVGLVRPTIVLPAWALRLDDDDLALIVRHEREHIEAGDPWLVHAAAWALVVMPWNPAIWWMAARLRLAVELDCDARVVAHAPNPSSEIAKYGDVLLQVATRHERRMTVVAPAMFESTSSLSRRIATMCASPVGRRSTKAVIAGIGAACLIGAAFASPVPDERELRPAVTRDRTEQEDAPATRVSPIASAPIVATTPPAEPRPTRASAAPRPQTTPSVTPDRIAHEAAPATRVEPIASPAIVATTPSPEPAPTRVSAAPRPQTTPSVGPVARPPSRLDLPGVRRPGDGVTAPVVIHQPLPKYTSDAMRRKVQGRVSLEVLVDEFGRVSEARVIEPLDADLDAEAVAAAYAWRFEPGVADGRPVETAVVLEMEFTIH